MPEDLPPDEPDAHGGTPGGDGGTETSGDTGAPPRSVRIAGAVVTFEGVVGVVYAIIVLIRAAMGHEEQGISGYGTAGWFILIFGGVLTAGVLLLLGRRGGRGVGIIAQILLAPVVFSLLGQSHQIVWGILLLIVVVTAFVALVHPRTSAWVAGGYARERSGGSADDGPGDED